MITSSLYSSTMAWQTSRMMTLMVFLATRKLYMRLGYLSPDASNLTVMASFKPVGSAFLMLVSCFSILGPTLCTNSSDMARRLHHEVVEEGLWVFYSELLHQSGVMSIQPPPLLCQPLTCLISSGSSPPLSIPGLLHISFKQVLLQDSNPDQSNIVQGSIFYRGCLEIRVGHGSGPSIGRIGLGRVGSRQCQTYLINVPFICKKSSTIILNNNKL